MTGHSSSPLCLSRCYAMARWTDMPRGGHFAALEQPGLLIADVVAFFTELP